MNNLSFMRVKETISNWLKSNEKLENNNVPVQMLINNESLLRAVLIFGECLAEIRVVEKPEFAPFRFVCFEMMGIEHGEISAVHTWYDDENTTLDDIIKSLDKAVDLALEYIELER